MNMKKTLRLLVNGTSLLVKCAFSTYLSHVLKCVVVDKFEKNGIIKCIKQKTKTSLEGF